MFASVSMVLTSLCGGNAHCQASQHAAHHITLRCDPAGAALKKSGNAGCAANNQAVDAGTDCNLYRAKLQGRNRVLGASSEPLLMPTDRSVPLVTVPEDGDHRETLARVPEAMPELERRHTAHTTSGPRFLQHISPSKTYAGLVGGLLAATLVTAAMLAGLGEDPMTGLILGPLIGLAAQAGDLAESMLKRAYNVKDSGKMIPGHGGMLDRVDALLFNAPMVLLWVQFGRVALPL